MCIIPNENLDLYKLALVVGGRLSFVILTKLLQAFFYDTNQANAFLRFAYFVSKLGN